MALCNPAKSYIGGGKNKTLQYVDSKGELSLQYPNIVENEKMEHYISV